MNKNPKFWIREDMNDNQIFITHGPTVICKLVGEDREEYAEIIQAALKVMWAVNPVNPIDALKVLKNLVNACEGLLLEASVHTNEDDNANSMFRHCRKEGK